MRCDLISIFPEFFTGPLQHGVVARAGRAGLVDLQTHDLRSFTHDRHRTVDDRPFGGGEGMVLKPEPIFECIESLGGWASRAERVRESARQSMIVLSPQGQQLDQALSSKLATLDRLALICGRYECVDYRFS